MSDKLFFIFLFLGISWPEISDFDLFKGFLNAKKKTQISQFWKKRKKKKKKTSKRFLSIFCLSLGPT
jgi:hypothetical protein